MNFDAGKVAAWAAVGGGAGALLTIASAGFSDPRMMAAILSNPSHWLPTPALIGAAAGAAFALTRK